MVTKTLKSAALIGLASSLALSPFNSNSQEYAYLPKQNEYIPETRASPPSLRPEESKQNSSTNHPVVLGIESPTNLRYNFAEKPSSEMEKFLDNGAVRAGEIINQRSLSDINLRFNRTDNSDYSWHNDYLNNRGIGMLRQGFEDAIRETPLYLRAQGFLETQVFEPYIEPPIRAFTTTFLNLFQSRKKAEKTGDKIEITAGLDLGPGIDPFVEEKERRKLIEISPGAIRINDGIKLKLSPNSLNLLYEDKLTHNSKFFAGAGYRGYSFDWQNASFDTDRSNVRLYTGFKGEIRGGFDYRFIIEGKKNLSGGTDRENEALVYFTIGKSL